MKRLLAGLVIGALIGGASALAAVTRADVRVPAGAVANVHPGGQGSHTTLLRFGAIDLRCDFYRTNAPPPETRVEPLLLCRRASNI
jgi:hypothetical protein